MIQSLSAPDRRRLVERLKGGLPPPPALAASTLVGMDRLLGTWRADLDGYVAGGGSLMRILAAPPGSGKTHLGDALRAEAAARGYMICAVEAQTGGRSSAKDNLSLYRSVCLGLTTPTAFLAEDRDARGLRSLILNAASRAPSSATKALRSVPVPVVALRDFLVSAVVAAQAGELDAPGWRDAFACASGEDPSMKFSDARRTWPRAFRALPKRPAGKDAHLWLRSLLLCVRALGYRGTVLVLDEHDHPNPQQLENVIVQMRVSLDRLAQGELPGTFVLYLMLDDFETRVQHSHVAVWQRIVPLTEHALEASLFTRQLSQLAGIQDDALLRGIGQRLFHVLRGREPNPAERAVIDRAARVELAGVDTRKFVRTIVSIIEEE